MGFQPHGARCTPKTLMADLTGYHPGSISGRNGTAKQPPHIPYGSRVWISFLRP
ncbi:hypothetical protein SLEP1_g43976 [Rubroshorea leprosula]|uniref:Uncharacterized protein n=1 Tax=Rubroshorea leprosula TaxID=152421 RepID=A0AAV5LFW6_9ROSI|nr:hypothetical protein SLEP1_g43976 [Rubroshorea leprosula]